MTGDHPHILVSLKASGVNGPSGRKNELLSRLNDKCAIILPTSVGIKVISSEYSVNWSVFRHSSAPYSPAFELNEPRVLVRLSLETDATDRERPLDAAAALARYALALAAELPVDVVCWPYAQLVSELGQLRMAMERFDLGQDVPVLQFVRMTVRRDGTLTSTGLYYFCGQEIRLMAVGQISPAGLVRRACRIAADAMLNGPYEKLEVLDGLAAGERIEIRPEPRGHWKRRPQWLAIQCDVRSAILSGMDA